MTGCGCIFVSHSEERFGLPCEREVRAISTQFSSFFRANVLKCSFQPGYFVRHYFSLSVNQEPTYNKHLSESDLRKSGPLAVSSDSFNCMDLPHSWHFTQGGLSTCKKIYFTFHVKCIL